MRDFLFAILSGYGLIGCLFAAWYCLIALRTRAPARVRCLWLPGAAAIWPLLAWHHARRHSP